VLQLGGNEESPERIPLDFATRSVAPDEHRAIAEVRVSYEKKNLLEITCRIAVIGGAANPGSGTPLETLVSLCAMPTPRRFLIRARVTIPIAAVAIGVWLGALAPTPPSASAATGPGFLAGTYGEDSSSSGYDIKRAIGFDMVYMPVTLGGIKGTLTRLNALNALGMKAVIETGSFDRDVRCGFERDDAWIRTVVTGLKGNPAIAAWQLGDEVNGRRTRTCTNIPDRMKKRTQLIKSIDPGAKTYITLGLSGVNAPYEYEKYVGTADILGLVIYPCVVGKTSCLWDKITNAIAEAKKDAIPQYWAVIQDFGNSFYRQPTATELRKELDLWKASNISGYFVYHWKIGAIESKPSHMDAYKAANLFFNS
jgi:hypothetical protein